MLSIKKSVLYLFMLSTSINNLSAFPFKSFIPSNVKEFCSYFSREFQERFRKKMDVEICRLLGSKEASEQYRKKAHKFLTYLGTKNAHDVPIRKRNKKAAKEIYVPASTALTGIWLNEEKYFTGKLGSSQLFTLAHEAAHYAHHHVIKETIFENLTGFSLTCICKILPISFLYNTIAKNKKPKNFLIFPLMSIATLAFLNFTQYLTAKKIGPFIINAYSRSKEKEADLTAAEMLCEHGHEHVIEDLIKIIKNNIEKGITASNNHPSIEEQLYYFQKFWAEWQQKNQKAVRG